MVNGSSVRPKHIRGVTPVVLAGGRGTRLEPVIGPHAKVLALVGGRPFLGYVLDKLVETGFSEAVLCVGFAAQEIAAEFGTQYKSLHLRYSEETEPLDTAGALRHAIPLIERNTALVLNGDSCYDGELTPFIEWHFNRPGFGSLIVGRRSDASTYGRVTLDPNDRVVSFEEKQPEPVPGWVNAGVYLLHQSLLERIPKDGPVSLERQMFRVWKDRGLWAYRGPADFLDMGTPERLAAAETFFARRAAPWTGKAAHGH